MSPQRGKRKDSEDGQRKVTIGATIIIISELSAVIIAVLACIGGIVLLVILNPDIDLDHDVFWGVVITVLIILVSTLGLMMMAILCGRVFILLGTGRPHKQSEQEKKEKTITIGRSFMAISLLLSIIGIALMLVFVFFMLKGDPLNEKYGFNDESFIFSVTSYLVGEILFFSGIGFVFFSKKKSVSWILIILPIVLFFWPLPFLISGYFNVELLDRCFGILFSLPPILYISNIVFGIIILVVVLGSKKKMGTKKRKE